MIIENTFTSLEELVPIKMPLLSPLIGPTRPMRWLLRNKWDNLKAASRLESVPILFLSSLRDQMLPPSQMRRLFELHPRLPWRFVSFAAAGHMDAFAVDPDAYWPAVHAFVRECTGLAAPRAREPAPATAEALDPPSAAGRSSAAAAAVADWETASTESTSEWEKIAPGEGRAEQ